MPEHNMFCTFCTRWKHLPVLHIRDIIVIEVQNVNRPDSQRIFTSTKKKSAGQKKKMGVSRENEQSWIWIHHGYQGDHAASDAPRIASPFHLRISFVLVLYHKWFLWTFVAALERFVITDFVIALSLRPVVGPPDCDFMYRRRSGKVFLRRGSQAGARVSNRDQHRDNSNEHSKILRSHRSKLSRQPGPDFSD